MQWGRFYVKYLVRATVLICAVIVVLFAAGWVFLASSLFAGPRKTLAEGILSRQLEQSVRIDGDIGLTPGRTLHVFAKDVALASPSMENLDLAGIGTLAFDLPVESLWNGQPRLSNLVVDGVRLELVTNEAGVSSWQFGNSKDSEQPQSAAPLAISDLIADRRLDMTNVSVLYQDGRNGLDLDLEMTELVLDRDDSGAVSSIHGSGALNSEAFTLSGRFPTRDSFDGLLEFDAVSLTVDGKSGETGLEAKVSADIEEFGQLLDILKLNRVLEGSGHVGAVFKSSGGVSRVDDLDVLVELDGGQSVSVIGKVGEIGNPDDVSLTTIIRLYPEDGAPAPTKKRSELQLVSVEMVMDSVPGQVPQRSMVIETNGFVLDTSGEGPPPIAVSQISRTAEGALKLGNIVLRIGPPAQPFVVLDGSVADALRLEGISADGKITVPAISLLQPLLSAGDHPLGGFVGDFNLNGNLDKLTLTSLNGSAENTELWDLDISGTVADVLHFQDVALNVEINAPSGAAVLEALNLEPVDVGQIEVALELNSAATNWNAMAHIALANSELSTSVELDDALTNPVLRGIIESDLIRLGDFRNIIAAAIQLRKLNDGSSAEAEDEPMPDPLQTRADGREVQPLVLPENVEQGPLRDVTLLPIGRAILLSGIDLDVDLELRKIEGTKGISAIETDLVLKDEVLSAGPVKFSYGDGNLEVGGSMDLKNKDHILNLTGKAGGWQLAELLEGLNYKKHASGTLYANFDVSGQTKSVKDFVRSMQGSATVSMHNGSIETQLLDLAGLGIMPWLFSDQKHKVAPIVCLTAPLSLVGGRVSTKSAALETDLVQIVVYGDVDIGQKMIDLHVQPRKVGEPLSRSPWPITISGPLAKPKIKVKDGPKQMHRRDGASRMPSKRKPGVPDILQLQ